METPKLPLIANFCDIDLFGKKIDIYYKGKSQRNSWIGRILTFLYIVVYLSFFIYRVIRMINKYDVKFYDTYAFNGEPPFIQINHEIFYSGMALINPFTGKPFIDQSIYDVKMFYISEGLNFSSKIELPIETCNINQFGSNYRDYFIKKNLNNLYCPKHLNQSLQGYRRYDSHDVYSYYTIQFFPCVNTSVNNNICAQKTNITKLLTEFRLTFNMQDIILTPNDYEKPVKHIPKELSFGMRSDLYVNVQSYWQVVNIETDEDIFGLGTSNNFRKEKYLKFNNYQVFYSTSHLNLDNPFFPLITIMINLSEQELTETRTYTDLISIIGDVGSFMEVIFSIISLLASILTETLYTKSLINHLFSFDLDKKLILVKKKEINIFKTQKSLQKYIPVKLLKINKNNNNEEEQNTIKGIENKNKINNNDNIQKENSEQDFIENRKKNILCKKNIKNPIFDMNIKVSKFSKKNYNFYPNESDGKLDNKSNSIIEKNMSDNNKDKEKESNFQKDKNIITKIELNRFKPKFCYKKQREYIEKILLEEAMEIISVKLDIQNIFKKIYKDVPNIEEKNSEYESIEMSDVCKKELNNILIKQNQTIAN